MAVKPFTPFLFRHQPLRTLYLFSETLYILFLRLPFYSVVFLLPSLRPRASWSYTQSLTSRALGRIVTVLFNAGLVVTAPTDIQKELKKASATGFTVVPAVPDGFVRGEVAEIAMKNGVKPAGASGYWYGRKGTEGRHGHPASENEKVFYHLHGGGFIMGNGSDSAGIAKLFLSVGKADRFFAITYRASAAAPFKPMNPFPAALLDCLSGYHYLVNTLGFRAENIIVSGDSAGGLMAQDLARYLASEGFPNLRQMGGLVLLSPAVDWANTHDDLPNNSMVRNEATDPVGPFFQSLYPARCLLGSLPLSDLPLNSWIAPASLRLPNPQGLFKNFPPTWITGGGSEVSVDSIRTLYERIAADNGEEKVEYHEYPDAAHDHLLYEYSQVHRQETMNDLKKWFDKICG